MQYTKPTAVVSAAIALMLGTAVPAQAASFLDGSTLNFALAFPSTTSGANTQVTVGAGQEFNAGSSNVSLWTADLSDSGLTIAFVSATHFTVPNTWTGPFTFAASTNLTLMNGLRISDLGNLAPAIGGVQVLPTTTLAGFSASRVRSDANTLLVDFAGLTSQTGDVVSLQISPVPEPAAWQLLAAGGALLAGLWRRSTAKY